VTEWQIVALGVAATLIGFQFYLWVILHGDVRYWRQQYLREVTRKDAPPPLTTFNWSTKTTTTRRRKRK
jgi:hypothetical protein